MSNEKEPGAFAEYGAPPLIGLGAGAGVGGALGAAGGYGAASLRGAALRNLAGSADKTALEQVIKTLPSKTKAILLGALLVGAPAGIAGGVSGATRNVDPYSARTAGGVAGGLTGLGLGYLLRTPGSPAASLIKALGMGALGTGAGALTGLSVGATRRGLADQKIRRLLEESRNAREGLVEEGK
jgi:hypothetical protein